MWEWKYDFARLFLPWGKFKSLILLCLALSQSKYWCRALSASQTYSSATMLLWLIQMCSSISESYLESKPWTRDAGGLPLPVLAGRLRWYLSQLTRWHQRVNHPKACRIACRCKLSQLACLLKARCLNSDNLLAIFFYQGGPKDSYFWLCCHLPHPFSSSLFSEARAFCIITDDDGFSNWGQPYIPWLLLPLPKYFGHALLIHAPALNTVGGIQN